MKTYKITCVPWFCAVDKNLPIWCLWRLREGFISHTGRVNPGRISTTQTPASQILRSKLTFTHIFQWCELRKCDEYKSTFLTSLAMKQYSINKYILLPLLFRYKPWASARVTLTINQKQSWVWTLRVQAWFTQVIIQLATKHYVANMHVGFIPNEVRQ